MRESFDFATEALEIADRCEYRLQQAEIHNFLAEWWLGDAGGRRPSEAAEVLLKARGHAERAKERARCDGPPHYYKAAYEKAEQLLKESGG